MYTVWSLVMVRNRLPAQLVKIDVAPFTLTRKGRGIPRFSARSNDEKKERLLSFGDKTDTMAGGGVAEEKFEEGSHRDRRHFRATRQKTTSRRSFPRSSTTTTTSRRNNRGPVSCKNPFDAVSRFPPLIRIEKLDGEIFAFRSKRLEAARRLW